MPNRISGSSVRFVCPPKVAPNDAALAIRSLTTQRGDLVEVEAAVGLRHVDAEQAELAAAFDQPARDGPVVLFEPVELGQHLLVDELPRRVPDQPMLVGETLRRQHLRGVGRFDEPGAAAKL